MHSPLDIDVAPDSLRGALRIRVRGALTARTAPRLITFLERRAHLPDSPELVVSLCGLDEVDPDARNQVMDHVAEHNARADVPTISLDLPLPDDAPAQWDESSPATESTGRQGTTVREVMVPIGATISCTQTLREAADRMPEQGCLVVLGLAHQPQGVIPRDRLHRLRQSEAPQWRHKLCASAEEAFVGEVSVDSAPPPDGVAGPLVVLDGDEPVGVVYVETARVSGSPTGRAR